jgi:hypothetical protein
MAVAGSTVQEAGLTEAVAAVGSIAASVAAEVGLIAGNEHEGRCMPQEANESLIFRRGDTEERCDDRPCVVVVKNREQLCRWLRESAPGLQWIQVEGLLGDPEAWSLATQDASEVPLDVVLTAPGEEFANLYRLVDVRSVRDLRVSMPATPGFLKALRLAASLGLPVRLLPGQPSVETLEELHQALGFYLHDGCVDAPIEFFHSALAWLRGAPTGSLWRILEEDPAIYRREEIEHPAPGFFASLIQDGAECASCPWQVFCEGYFKWPDPAYSCAGVKALLDRLRAAAAEIEADLTAHAAESA